jgi:hypothetical protein
VVVAGNAAVGVHDHIRATGVRVAVSTVDDDAVGVGVCGANRGADRVGVSREGAHSSKCGRSSDDESETLLHKISLSGTTKADEAERMCGVTMRVGPFSRPAFSLVAIEERARHRVPTLRGQKFLSVKRTFPHNAAASR